MSSLLFQSRYAPAAVASLWALLFVHTNNMMSAQGPPSGPEVEARRSKLRWLTLMVFVMLLSVIYAARFFADYPEAPAAGGKRGRRAGGGRMPGGGGGGGEYGPSSPEPVLRQPYGGAAPL